MNVHLIAQGRSGIVFPSKLALRGGGSVVGNQKGGTICTQCFLRIPECFSELSSFALLSQNERRVVDFPMRRLKRQK